MAALNGPSEARELVTLDDLSILNKDGLIVPLVPNEPQRRLLDQVCPHWQQHDYRIRGMRRMILKARQEGMSTIVLALYFLDTINTPGTISVVMAHEKESTERLFRIVQRFYQRLPKHKQPPYRYASRREYLWPDIDSSFFIGTAGSDTFGRSATIRNVLGSEAAHWPRPTEIMAGLMEAVPKSGNIVLESTANGIGNYFQTEWDEAEKRANGDTTAETVFTGQFFPWFLMEEYRETPDPNDPPNAEFRRIQKVYRLDDRQIAWYWSKKKSLKEKLPQEHPCSSLEAFLASGNPYFNRQRIKEWADSAPKPLPLDAQMIPAQYRRIRRALREGQLQIWSLPKPNIPYAIGADTAEGVDKDKRRDFDSADVGDALSWGQVAHLHGKWDTHYYGLLLGELGRWYNVALLGVERNNHGHAVLDALIHADFYPSMYEVDPSSVAGGLYYFEAYDEVKKVTVQKPGWDTNTKSKFFALDSLATSIEENVTRYVSQISLKELMTYIHLPGGKAGGDVGCHDDAVSSAAVLDQMFRLRPRQHGKLSLPPSDLTQVHTPAAALAEKAAKEQQAQAQLSKDQREQLERLGLLKRR